MNEKKISNENKISLEAYKTSIFNSKQDITKLKDTFVLLTDNGNIEYSEIVNILKSIILEIKERSNSVNDYCIDIKDYNKFIECQELQEMMVEIHHYVLQMFKNESISKDEFRDFIGTYHGMNYDVCKDVLLSTIIRNEKNLSSSGLEVVGYMKINEEKLKELDISK